MSVELRTQIGIVRNDLARLESILPSQVVWKTLSQAEESSNNEVLTAYREIRIFQHSRGWLLKALLRILMPFRLVSRSVVSRRVTLSIPAALYSLLLGLVWMLLIMNRGVLLLACVLTWVLVVLAALAPRVAAYYYLKKNRDCYRYVQHLGEVGIYGLE